MSKCSGCGQFLSVVDAAKCRRCNCSYHRRCAALPPAGELSPSWQCANCIKAMKARAGGTTLVAPVRDAATPLNKGPENTTALTGDITAELIIFRDNLRSINKDMQLFREDIADIRASIREHQDQLVHLESRVCHLEKQPPDCTCKVDDVIAQLKLDLNDRDQELLANDVEIANLPETSGENPVHLVIQIATKIGIALDVRDIVSAERVGGRHLIATESTGPEPRSRPISLRLARRGLRDEMLKNARERRGATSADLGMAGPPRRFYINERLTKSNRQLFRLVREASQRHGWMFVWCKRGRIHARSKPGDQVYTLRSVADIERIFGS